jgi:hypothetical protein
LGEVESNRSQKQVGGGIYKAAPLERSKYSKAGNKCDPYVVRAIERAQNKIKDCIFQMNGRHVN